MLDGGVIRFDLGRCCAGDDEDFDLVPPAADRAPEPVRLGLPIAESRVYSPRCKEPLAALPRDVGSVNVMTRWSR